MFTYGNQNTTIMYEGLPFQSYMEMFVCAYPSTDIGPGL